jgi:hypothetical protein
MYSGIIRGLLPLLSLIAWQLPVGTGEATAAAPGPGPLVETPEQFARRMQWWRDARFGMFIHWPPEGPLRLPLIDLKLAEVKTLSGGKATVETRDNAIQVSLGDNPHFPALRSGPTAVSGATRQKQIPSSK